MFFSVLTCTFCVVHYASLVLVSLPGTGWHVGLLDGINIKSTFSHLHHMKITLKTSIG